MIVELGGNPFTRALVIITFGWRMLIPMAAYSTGVYFIYKHFQLDFLAIPATPVTILGVGLSIFLGFKNSSAYDRWWEARKIWGGIVNISRTWTMEVMAVVIPPPKKKGGEKMANEMKKSLIYRHIAWMNALRFQLRGQSTWQELQGLLRKDEWAQIEATRNKATMLNHLQGLHLKELHEEGYINDFQQIQLLQTLQKNYDLQGMCERIKNTPFPRYYRYFTRIFLALFMIMIPFVMLKPFGIVGIPISASVGFVFWLIEQSGRFTEDPFENSFNDTPMTALCRTIEIDMRQQLGETELPPPVKPEYGILM